MDQLIIIVVCFNEENIIESCLCVLMVVVRDVEIFVIYGGMDKIFEIVWVIVKDYFCIWMYKNFGDFGKGYVIKLGIMVIDWFYILQFDVDMQFDLVDLLKVVQLLLGGSVDVVIGFWFYFELDLMQY